jgi:hypothetical protein
MCTLLQAQWLLRCSHRYQNLIAAAMISEDVAWVWPKKQVLWQLYLPHAKFRPSHIYPDLGHHPGTLLEAMSAFFSRRMPSNI